MSFGSAPSAPESGEEPPPADAPTPHLPDPAPSVRSTSSVDGAAGSPPEGETEVDDTDAVSERPGPGSSAVRRHKAVRRILRGAALVVLVLVVYYLVSLYQVWSVGRADQRGPVDAIVVMGAAQYDGRPSPQLAARLDHVLELWPEEVAPYVVVTGGNLPGDRFTEAEASAAYLVERGVPDASILSENEGSNSFESLEAAAALLDVRGLDEVVIVTDPYHALRSREIAEELGLAARVSSTDTSVVTGGDSFVRHLREAGGVAIGRIIGFERLSDLTD